MKLYVRQCVNRSCNGFFYSNKNYNDLLLCEKCIKKCIKKSNTTPKFKNKDGSLTQYSFACGYIQTKTLKTGVEVRLEKDGCYHVKTRNSKIKDTWNSFDSLSEARKFFKSIKGMN